MASEKQINFINSLIEKKGMHTAWNIINRVSFNTAQSVEELNGGQASAVIGFLLEEPNFNEKAFLAAQQAGLSRYEKLVQWAKDNGVKGARARMKTTTLMNLIESAGLTPPTELVRA
jgi:hypothetical protein